MRQNIILITGLSLLSGVSVAQSVVIAPQPTACMDASFFSTHRPKYGIGNTIGLTITNHCGQTIDLQNSSITFLNTKHLNTLFWGNFSSLSYPSNPMKITSQPLDEQYLSTLSLQFPDGEKSNTTLANEASFTIYYAVKQPAYVDHSVRVYLNAAVNTGNIRLVNGTNQPANVSELSTQVTLSQNGETISSVNLPWAGQQLVSGLAPGAYDISPINLDADDEDHQYEGTGSSAQLTVNSGETASTVIQYTEKLLMSSIRLQLQDLPAVLTGYSETPKVTMTREDNHSAQIANIQWGSIQDASHLAGNKIKYHFSTSDITYNGYTCTPSFEPSSIAATHTKPVVKLSYACTETEPNTVTLSIEGAPSSLTSLDILFTPNGNAAPIKETVSLVNGKGASTTSFPEGAIYTVTASELEGYSATYSADKLTVSEGAVETIVYTKNSQTEPEVAVTPDAPEVSVNTTEPEVAVTPDAPEVSAETTEPEVAVTPDAPEVSVETTEPEVAVTPDAPEVSAETTEPEVAVTPDVPEVSVETTEPEVAVTPDAPEVSVETTEPEVAVTPEVPKEEAITADATEVKD